MNSLNDNTSSSFNENPPPLIIPTTLTSPSSQSADNTTITIPSSTTISTSSSSSSSSVVITTNAPSTPPSAALSNDRRSLSYTASASLAKSSVSSSSSSSSYKTALLRLMSDLKVFDEHDAPEGVSASPLDSDNLFLWRACIFGPSDTSWEGGIFQLQLHFPKEYPQKPPIARFTSKIYHPNVFADGTLCLDILQDQWSPIYTVSTILTSIQSLLTDPNPASPANPEAAKLLQSDPKEYRKKTDLTVTSYEETTDPFAL